eukprot:623396-Alexandrium_andersonii.AAC.1
MHSKSARQLMYLPAVCFKDTTHCCRLSACLGHAQNVINIMARSVTERASIMLRVARFECKVLAP